MNNGDVAYQRAYQAFSKQAIKPRYDEGVLRRDLFRSLGKPHSFLPECEPGERWRDIIEVQLIAEIHRNTVTGFLGED